MDEIMNCKICNIESLPIFKAQILKKYEVQYYHCSKCDFVQTENPYWLKESYEDSINTSDTGLLSRNLYLARLTSILIYLFFDKTKKFLDFAGGYGIFTRLMRDIGFDFYWSDKYSENLLSKGFEYKENGEYQLLTSFETFEHFDEPSSEIENMLKMSKNIIFSTELFSGKPPKPNEWDYYGLGHGQHISLYSRKTLEFIAKKYGLHFYSNGRNFHLLTERKINRLIFKFSLKLNRFGLYHFVTKMMNSKTIEDWKLLK